MGKLVFESAGLFEEPEPLEPPEGGWLKPTCSWESHKWHMEIEDGKVSVHCTDPCGPAEHFDPSLPVPVCVAMQEGYFEPEDFGTDAWNQPWPVKLTYVDDSTPSTPAGPAEYGFYFTLAPDVPDLDRLAKLADWIERDRREPDKVLAYAQDIRSVLARKG